MKKLIIFVLVVVVLVGGFYFYQRFNKTTPALDGSSVTSNWQTYHNKQYGFEFKYPSGWEIYDHSRIILNEPSINVLISKANPKLVELENASYLLRVVMAPDGSKTIRENGFFRLLPGSGGPQPFDMDHSILVNTDEYKQAQLIFSTFKFTK